MLDRQYAEPYAGGASVALSLLYNEFASVIHINDLDRSIYAFWRAAVDETEALCALIADCDVSMEEWERQQRVQAASDSSVLELAFSTFFLNRTNRSGIITAGVIGGKSQDGNWKLDARFNKSDLISRIEKIGRFRERIEVYNLDCIEFIDEVLPCLPSDTFLYLDPPYYEKGAELYENHYEHDDHSSISLRMAELDNPWIVSYDNVEQISRIYAAFTSIEYGISYSAQQRYRGSEIMFASDGLSFPAADDPARINSAEYRRQRLAYA